MSAPSLITPPAAPSTDQRAEPVGATEAPFPVLVAVTDDGFAPAAVHLAEALAGQRHATPRLVYVIELNMYATPEASLGFAALSEELLDATSRERTEARLRANLHLDTGPASGWPFDIELGSSASCIVQRARLTGAQLIIMGLHTHGVVGRAMGNDTLREVMAMSGVPVFGTVQMCRTLPKRIVVGVDFSHASLRAARLARRVLADDGSMYLVFVTRDRGDRLSEAEEAQRLIESHGVQGAFDELVHSLAPAPGMLIAPVSCVGDPAAELKRVSETIEPDLLAVGTQRRPLIERMRLGSVATSMVHDGRWSVLVVPPTEADEPAGLG